MKKLTLFVVFIWVFSSCDYFPNDNYQELSNRCDSLEQMIIELSTALLQVAETQSKLAETQNAIVNNLRVTVENQQMIIDLLKYD